MLTGLILLLGLVLAVAALLLLGFGTKSEGPAEAVARVLEVLPRTQCRKCGYAGCEPYAAALADGRASIERCLPGGEPVAAALAALLGQERPRDIAWHEPPHIVIDENACIGCARCLVVCPVDAILGAPRQLHAILADWCTGCALCVPVCPVDCILAGSALPDRQTWRWPMPRWPGPSLPGQLR
ncbi:MAG: RnfABCDGE type electron transport complex subunit B [Gammaproteobacteria bacterium]|nr:RnfABCDGE type electron transport complex subunit B [Gammaproteobacteria bacterium]